MEVSLMAPEVREGIAQWHEATTERERALAEERVYAAICQHHASWVASLKSTHRRSRELERVLQHPEAGRHVLAHRSSLLRSGEAARPLWERLDRDLTWATAAQLLARAHTLSGEQPTLGLASAFERALDEYDALPGSQHLGGGKVVRRRTAARRRRAATPAVGAAEPVEFAFEPDKDCAEETPASPASPPMGSSTGRSTFRESVRSLARDEVTRRLPNMNAHDVEALASELDRDVDIALEQFTRRILTARQEAKFRIPRSAMEEACEVLSLPPPARGSLPDVSAARQRKRALAQAYHPDRSGGRTSDLFQRVIEAFSTIEGFVRQQQGGT